MTTLKKIYEMYNDKICLSPFLSAFYQTFNNSSQPKTNRILPCCVIHSSSNDSIINGSILETINSPQWQKLRKDFVEGRFEQLAQCKNCYNAEQHGAQSVRIGANQYLVDTTAGDVTQRIQEIIDNDYKVKELPNIHIFPSNYCNFSCVMCFGGSSTTRRSFEIKFLNHRTTEPVINEPDADFWEILKTVDSINFAGGETALQPEVHQIIDYLVNQGLAQNITITLLSNASKYPERLTEQFRKFKKVIYNCSVDGVGDVIEYQRRGAVWSDVEHNTLRLVHHDFITTVINYVFSSINVLNFMDFADWVFQNRIKYVTLSHVSYSEQFGIVSLPPELRQLALDRLNAGLKKYASGTDPEYIYTRKCIEQAHDMIQYTPYNPAMTEKFVRAVVLEDQASKKKLIDIVPEWRPWFEVDSAQV